MNVELEPTITDRLYLEQVASCGCGTKTPEAKHHLAECKFRVLQDAIEHIDQQAQRIDEQEQELEALQSLLEMYGAGNDDYKKVNAAQATKIEALEAENAEEAAFILKAFMAHPNLDLDIQMYERMNPTPPLET